MAIGHTEYGIQKGNYLLIGPRVFHQLTRYCLLPTLNEPVFLILAIDLHNSFIETVFR
jgi:hypothetical protein